MEEYFSAGRLKQLPIGIVVKINKEGEDRCFTARFVGLDEERTVILTLPPPRTLQEQGVDTSFFEQDGLFEVRCIFDGRIVAFETKPTKIYEDRLLMCQYPEMVETRKLRAETRFPCTISCDIWLGNHASLGVITDISNGGCQLTIRRGEEYLFLAQAVDVDVDIDLGLFFPHYEEATILKAKVKSAFCKEEGQCMVGLAFTEQYEDVRLYLESLQLDSVAPFFN